MSELYHPVKIGNLTLDGNLFLAPVAGYSDRAFRSICTDFGSDFAYTEMVSSEALTRGSEKTEALMRRAPNEKNYAVQIFGGIPETMANAARMVLERTSCECIDINGGCPVPKIIKSGAGCELTKNPDKLYSIVKAVVEASKNYEGKRTDKNGNLVDYNGEVVPVTVKIRLGWDSEHITWKECTEAALKAGASAITMHGRTRAQGYEGKANWNAIAELVKFIDKRIPVFGNGDAFTPEDAKNMLEQTGCDGVMFARGAMGNPFIFKRTREFLQTGKITEIDMSEKIRAGFRELELLTTDMGEKGACLEMRKRFCAYTKGIEGSAALRKELVNSNTIEDYKNVLKNYL